MGISDLFNTLANNIILRYQEMAGNSAIRRLALKYYNEPQQDSAAPENTDTYEPSCVDTPTAELSDIADPTKVIADDPADENVEVVPSSDPEPEVIEEVPVQPYRFRHHTHLNYEVRLQFQLQAIASIAQQIADGEEVSVEELFGAGFGLQAAMDIRGKQTVEAGGADKALGDEHVRKTDLVKARNAHSFAAQSQNFALESFSRESLRIKSAMDVKTGESYQRAVNKFALRYRMDTQFSVAVLNRFNVQTERVAQDMPENLEKYCESCGGVAESGTVQMMTAFFDAVDAYLDQAEDALLQRANEFFDLAANELGYSEAMIASAKADVINTIESFFGRVDEAMGNMRSFFLPEQVESLPPVENLLVPEVYDAYNSVPKDMPAEVAMA